MVFWKWKCTESLHEWLSTICDWLLWRLVLHLLGNKLSLDTKLGTIKGWVHCLCLQWPPNLAVPKNLSCCNFKYWAILGFLRFLVAVLSHHAHLLLYCINISGEKKPLRLGVLKQPVTSGFLKHQRRWYYKQKKCLVCYFSWCCLSNLRYVPTLEIFWSYSWVSGSYKYLRWLGEARHKNSDSTSRKKRDLFDYQTQLENSGLHASL